MEQDSRPLPSAHDLARAIAERYGNGADPNAPLGPYRVRRECGHASWRDESAVHPATVWCDVCDRDVSLVVNRAG